MKILMLTCQYMPDVFGGAEKQCGRVSKGINAQGVDVQILTSRQTLKGKSKEVIDAVPITRLYSPFAPDLLGRWILFSFYWFLRVLIWGVFNHKSFDIIHCHQGKFGAFVGCFLARMFKKPILIKVGNSNQFMDFSALKAKKIVGPILANFVLKTNPTIVAISDVIAKNCDEFGFEKIINIPNCIDTTLINNEILNLKDKKDSNVNFFYHGRLEPIKKIEILLEAFYILTKTHENIYLHLIGIGSVLPNTEKYITEKKLKNNVILYGEVPDPIKLIQQFDIFVNASEAEGFSNSLLEALLTGKVLVSTPVSGAKDAIYDGKNGYVAKGFSALDIKCSIENSIDLYHSSIDEVKTFSDNLISASFTVDVIAKKYVELYKKLIIN